MDLDRNLLALSVGDSIFHADAAGYGWFVDSTPGIDEEFGLLAGVGVLEAGSASAARDAMDLLSALGHELGQVIGLPHATGAEGDFAIMRETLAAGARITKFEAQASLDTARPAPSQVQTSRA